MISRQFVLLGGGRHSRVVLDIVQYQNPPWDHILMYDDNNDNDNNATIDYRGPFSQFAQDWLTMDKANTVCCLAFGHVPLRKQWLAEWEPLDIVWATVIHPSAIISPSAVIDKGTLVCAGAIVGCHATIGAHSIINTGAQVDHDGRIGDNVHLSPGVILCGTVSIKAHTWVGAGAIVFPHVHISQDVVVGAGTVVRHSIVTPGVTVVGNPARVL